MIRHFPYSSVRKQIAQQRRKNLDDRIRLRQMTRLFASTHERQQRKALEELRNQDWKSFSQEA